MKKIVKSNSPEETRKIANNIAKKCFAGNVVCLRGELGAGKTAFAKGFAKGLGIFQEVTSPTFSILNIYEGENGSLPLYHFDVYRILSADEMDDTGYEDYFYGNGVCLVEWAEMINDLIPENAVWVTIKKDISIGENYREVIIEGGEMFG